jgi:KDO2-lipid IV(A) lauroyltransferase
MALEYGVFTACVALARALPLQLALALGRTLAGTAYLLDGRHRRRVARNLCHAGVAGNPAEARRLAWRNFQEFGRMIVELAKMRQFITPENIPGHLRLGGDPEAKELFFSGRDGVPPSPAIIVTAHYGNWELAGMGYTLASGHPLTSIIRPLDNPLIGKWFHRQRQGFGHRLQGKDGALKSLLGALRRGESVCILADQHAIRAQGVETVFFGHPARTHTSPALLHLHTGVPILVALSRRLPGDFQFEFTLAPPIRLAPGKDKDADIRHLAQAYTGALEGLIRQDPIQWLWAHRRWLDIDR